MVMWHYFIINILFAQNNWSLQKHYQDARSYYQAKWDLEQYINKNKKHY